MQFQRYFKIVSHKPGMIGITPLVYCRASLTVSQAMEMANHILKICAVMDATEASLSGAVKKQGEN